MSCIFADLPEGFKPLPDFVSQAPGKFKDLTEQIETKKSLFRWLPGGYHSYVPLRVVVGILVIVAIAVGVMHNQGILTSFPQDFVSFFQHHWTYITIAAVGFTILTIGAAIIIHRVLHQTKDRITDKGIEALKGDGHWISALYVPEGGGESMPGHIDTSTLDEKGSGKAFMYAYKMPQEHYHVSLTMIAASPLHMLGAIAYNVARLFVMPIYILYRMNTDEPNPWHSEKTFRYSDIGVETRQSLYRIARAPFYAMAVIYAALYSLIDPLNGRKLGSYLERDWNDGVTRAEGFWSVRGPQPLWKLEGGRVRGKLGQNGFYAAGCWQPVAVVIYKNGEIVEGMSLSKAVDKQAGKNYTILTAQTLKKEHNLLIKQVKKQGH